MSDDLPDKKVPFQDQVLICNCGWSGERKKTVYNRPFGRHCGYSTWNCPVCQQELDSFDSTD